MKTNNISKKLDLIRKLCKSNLMCHEYHLFGLSRLDCVNRAVDLAARQWGFKREDMTLSGEWHEYKFDLVKEITITANDKSNACIRIGKSPTNLYTFATSICLRRSGGGGPLTIWSDLQFYDTTDAIDHGFSDIERYCNSKNVDPEDTKCILKKLDEIRRKTNPMQLSLF